MTYNEDFNLGLFNTFGPCNSFLTAFFSESGSCNSTALFRQQIYQQTLIQNQTTILMNEEVVTD